MKLTSKQYLNDDWEVNHSISNCKHQLLTVVTSGTLQSNPSVGHPAVVINSPLASIYRFTEYGWWHF
jgi:hypothetical protein